MRLETEVVTVHTTHPFVIARGGSSEWKVVWVRLIDEQGIEGWGEAAPSRFYGETSDTVLAALERLRPIIESSNVSDIEQVETAMASALRFNAAARCAVSAALHDLQGKRLGVPLWQLWGLTPSASPRSSFTIAIAADDDTLRDRVLDAVNAGYPILKVKLGSDRDRRIIQLVRDEAPTAVLRVDANAAWTPKHTLAMAPLLADLGVEFIEQPVAPQDIDGLRFIRERCALPIVADESCLVASDVVKLAGVVDGVNLKLAKCGSLREALRIIHTARAHGMMVMAGCMIETSLGITAAAHLGPLLDCVDLDGAALLRDDPFIGATITQGIVTLPTTPGLGVTRRV
ncbi:MAG TPA: dipeptide epimerase [Gemmatimonadaceae bacterium]|nr:dipeptide epimerase [Gemmatimonadaceae bacterium]